MIFLFFLLLAVAILFITRPLTVLFHELGHAIPALLLTRQKVTIYLGSYGDPSNSVRFRIGLLEIWMRYHLFWVKGLCVSSAGDKSFYKILIYTICGPISSLVIASVASYFTFLFDLHGALKLVLVLFLMSSVFDLFINLIPSSNPIVLYNGTITFNDGYSLRNLIKSQKHWPAYKKAVDIYYSGDYEQASVLLEQLIAENCDNDNAYKALISCYIFIGKNEQVPTVFELLEKRNGLSSVEYYHLGVAQVSLGRLEESLQNFQKAIDLNVADSAAHNYMGYAYIMLNEYAKAIPCFDTALNLDPSLAYAFNNRGEAKLRLGYTEEALKDLEQSLRLNDKNPYVYRSLGMYYIVKKEPEPALACLAKAKELCTDLELIDEFIEDAKALSENNESIA